MSTPTPHQIRFSRKLKAAVDLYVIGSSGRYAREQIFNVLTENDPEMPGLLGRLLEGFPPAEFDLELLPVPMTTPSNPSLN